MSEPEKNVTSNDSRNRQATFKAKMKEAGFVQVGLWVHKSQVDGILQAGRRLRSNPSLEVGPLRDQTTKKLAPLETTE